MTVIRFCCNENGDVVMQATDGADSHVDLASVDFDEGRIPTKPLYRLAEIAARLRRENPSISFENNVPKDVAPWLDYWLGLEATPSLGKPPDMRPRTPKLPRKK